MKRENPILAPKNWFQPTKPAIGNKFQAAKEGKLVSKLASPSRFTIPGYAPLGAGGVQLGLHSFHPVFEFFRGKVLPHTIYFYRKTEWG
jgi:hypothetical protein